MLLQTENWIAPSPLTNDWKYPLANTNNIVSGLWLLYTNQKHIGWLFSRKKLTYQSIWQLAQITITLLLHRHNALHVLFHCSVSSMLYMLSYHCCYLIQFGYFLVNFNILSIWTLLKQWSCKFFCAEKKTSMIGSIIVSFPFFTQWRSWQLSLSLPRSN